jgi:PAS domain S-box-containing protein
VMRIFKKLSLRAKMLVGFSLATAILALVGIYLGVIFSTTNDSFLQLNQNYVELRGFLTLEVDNKKLTDAVKSFILTKDSKWETFYDKISTDLDDTLNNLKLTVEKPTERQALSKFEQISAELKGTELLIIEKVREGDTTKAVKLFDAIYDERQVEISEIVAQLVKNKNNEVTTIVIQSRELLDNTQRGAIIFIILGLLFTAIFSFYFAGYLTRSIAILVAAAEKLTYGDLSVRAEINSRDEIEKLGTQFNIMAASLEDAFRKLKLHEEVISAERNKLAVVLSGIVDAVIAVDLNREVVIFNKAAEKLTGFSLSEVKGRPIESLIKVYAGKSELGPREYCPIRTDNFEGVVFSQKNLRILGKGGRAVVTNLIAGQIAEGAQVNLGCIITLHDLTQVSLK